MRLVYGLNLRNLALGGLGTNGGLLKTGKLKSFILVPSKDEFFFKVKNFFVFLNESNKFLQ